MSENTWRHGWRIVRQHPVLFPVSLVHYLLFYSLPLLAGLVLREIFDALGASVSAGHNAWTLVGVLAGVEVSRLVVIYSAAWFGTRFDYGVETLLRHNMLAWLVRGPGARRLPATSGDALSRFRDDVGEINSFIEAWIDLPGELLLCIGAIVIMLSINVPITLTVILPLMMVVVVTDRLTGRIQVLRNLTRQSAADASGFLGEALGAIGAVRLAGTQAHVVAHLEMLNEKRRHAATRDRAFDAMLAGFSSNIADVGFGVVLLLAATAMSSGSFTVGDFVLFAAYLQLATGGPRWIGRTLARRRQADVSVARVNELMAGADRYALSASPATTERGTQPVAGPLRQLVLADLTVVQAGGGPGIRGINLNLEQGTITFVTGAVACGKSTLLRAVLGLVQAETGSVYWNDWHADDPASFMVPPRCAYTPQEPTLFSATVRENILMGRQVPAAQLDDVVTVAMLGDDLLQLPGGLDTMVGPRGVRLSGGQIQRVAAARMLLTGAELFVFDDLASALDAATEERLWRLWSERRYTCLGVAHSRAAFRAADQIVVMADGQIVDQGTLADLMARSYVFQAIWEAAS